MTRKKSLYYPIAGLDFIFDMDLKPWFLEANSASTVHMEFEKVYGECTTIKRIARYINSLEGNNFCIFSRRNAKPNKEQAWFTERLRNYVKKDYHVCYMDDNLRIARKYFIDHNFIRLTLTNFNKGGGNTYVLNSSRRKVRPDIILRSYFQLNQDFEKEGVNVINSMVTRDIVWFKHKCYEAVKNVKGLNIPKYFLVNSQEDLRNVLNDNRDLFCSGYVVKPLGNSLGRFVKITDSCRMPINYKVRPGYMVQQRIIPPLVEGRKFWDLRVFVINGSYVGSVKRVSRNKVTNIARGGYGDAVEKKLERKIRGISEKVTKAIERKAREMGRENYILTPAKPMLREAMCHPLGEE